MTIVKKMEQRISVADTLVCIGLDSDLKQLPDRFKSLKWPQFEFNKWIIEQTHEFALAYKPNMAFYESRGANGLDDLERTMDYLHSHHSDIITICDAKRADIDSTNEGYVEAIFDRLGFDAVTLNPYLGAEALRPFLERTDKASIILCKTSNQGSGEFQDVLVTNQSGLSVPLWQKVAQVVAEQWNKEKNCMLVVGATYPEQLKVVRGIVQDLPLLIPGIGAQGGDLAATLEAGLTKDRSGLIINSARGIIFSDQPRVAAKTLFERINQLR